jgi:hypothetical protein
MQYENAKRNPRVWRVCAGCRRIRDDDGHWVRVHAMPPTPGDVLLTHGICPECMERLYPEYCEEGEDDIAHSA